tara:strand:- start:207 stop:1274 length:1068 start_codon:yes stop_codon:yes gene_type:complete
MNIPKTRGKTSLAYVTNEERKLLRRRDAVKGSPNAKTSPQGIPNLRGSDYELDMERARVLREKEKALKDAGFIESMIMGGDAGDFGYFHPGKKLTSGLLGAPTDAPTPSSRPMGIPKEDWGKTIKVAPITPTTKAVSPKPKKGGGKKPGTPAVDPLPDEPLTDPIADPISDPVADTTNDPSPGGGVNATIDQSQLQQPMLDEIVADGVNSELLETRLTNLINKNNPLFKAATTKAMQAMAARGLVNSSIAEEAVMSAILSVAIPIAERDASAYMNQRMQNQAYSNEFKAQQNQAYYAQFMQKLQYSMDTAMRQLIERSANWRAVLAQRGVIATTSGMDTPATEAAMGAVTPDWWA